MLTSLKQIKTIKIKIIINVSKTKAKTLLKKQNESSKNLVSHEGSETPESPKAVELKKQIDTGKLRF